MAGLVSEYPYRIGVPLGGRWKGARAVHFGSDNYRLVWEVDEEREIVTVLIVGRKKRSHGTIYDRPRPGT